MTKTGFRTHSKYNFDKCSAFRHDPSAGRNAQMPPPSEILEDIASLKDWTTSLRDRQKVYNN